MAEKRFDSRHMPWTAQIEPAKGAELYTCHGEWIGLIDDFEDGEHIVACANACAGMTDEQLSDITKYGGGIQATMNRLVANGADAATQYMQERDAARAALSDAEKLLDDLLDLRVLENAPDLRETIKITCQKARAALAQGEGDGKG